MVPFTNMAKTSCTSSIWTDNANMAKLWLDDDCWGRAFPVGGKKSTEPALLPQPPKVIKSEMRINPDVCAECDSQMFYISGKFSCGDKTVCSECGVSGKTILVSDSYATSSSGNSRQYANTSLGTKIGGRDNLAVMSMWFSTTNRERKRLAMTKQMTAFAIVHDIPYPIVESAMNMFYMIIERKYATVESVATGGAIGGAIGGATGGTTGGTTTTGGTESDEVATATTADGSRTPAADGSRTTTHRRISNMGQMGALILISSEKIEKKPYLIADVAQMCGISVRLLGRSKTATMELLSKEEIYSSFQQPQSCDYIRGYAKKLDLPKSIIAKSEKLAVNVDMCNLTSGHQANSVAATIILIASERNGHTLTKGTLKKQLKISEPTILKIYPKIMRKIGILEDDMACRAFVRQLSTANVRCDSSAGSAVISPPTQATKTVNQVF